MLTAGVIYILVAISAALTVPVDQLADSDAALLEVVEAGIIPIPVGVMTIVFAIIAMTAITNTTLVSVVTQSRILYGMAREDVVPAAFAKIHPTRRSPFVGLGFSFIVVSGLLIVGTLLNRAGADIDVVERLATVTVVFLLFIYALVIVVLPQAPRPRRGRGDLPRQHRTARRGPGRQHRAARLRRVRRPVLPLLGRSPCWPSVSCCSWWRPSVGSRKSARKQEA